MVYESNMLIKKLNGKNILTFIYKRRWNTWRPPESSRLVDGRYRARLTIWKFLFIHASVPTSTLEFYSSKSPYSVLLPSQRECLVIQITTGFFSYDPRQRKNPLSQEPLAIKNVKKSTNLRNSFIPDEKQ